MRIGAFTPAYREQCTVMHKYSQLRDMAWALQNGHEFYPFHSSTCRVQVQRNWAVKHARENDCDWLMMQDSDCAGLEGSTLAHMLKVASKHEAAMVGLVFMCRDGQTVNCNPVEPGRAVEGEVGAGMILLNMRMLAKEPLPWFEDQLTEDKTGVLCGQDIDICRRLRRGGYRVIVDYTQPTVHVAEEGMVLRP